MQIHESFLEEITARFPLSSLIKRYVPLVKKGKEHSGLCPFHSEKSPSFTVNDHKGRYYCFGCGASGGNVRFLMEKEKYNFLDAVAFLAKEAGLALPENTEQDQAQGSLEKNLFLLMEEVCIWYQQQLTEPSGEKARIYLKQRFITFQEIRHFRLGYAPLERESQSNLYALLLQKGWKKDILHASGLFLESKRGASSGSYFDRFRERIIFPIMDIRGRVIAFGGRILPHATSEKSGPKYLNSSETLVFKKSNVLYGLHAASHAMHKAETAIVVEGYMDVIALHRIGLTHAVAPLGTALTETHLLQLWKEVDEPVLCFDGDEAGIRAMIRAAHASLPFLQPGKSLKCCILPANLDPDDVINTQGKEGFLTLLKEGKQLSALLYDWAYHQSPPSSPEAKARLWKKLQGITKNIQHSKVKLYFENYYKELLYALGRQTKTLTSTPSPFSHQKNLTLSLESSKDMYYLYVCTLLLIILREPSLLQEEEVHAVFLSLDPTHSSVDELKDKLLRCHEDPSFCKEWEDYRTQESTLVLLEEITKNASMVIGCFLDSPFYLHTSCLYIIDKLHLMQLEKEYTALLSKGDASDLLHERALALQREIKKWEKKTSQQREKLWKLVET